MKTHTSGFTTALRTFGREINCQMIYGATTYDKTSLNRMVLGYNTALNKTVMKYAEIDSNNTVPIDGIIQCKIGVKVSGTYEYLDYGNYIVTQTPIYNADTKSYIIKGYDKMVESMFKYDDSPLEVTYPITVKNLLLAICTLLGWTLSTTTFPNDDIEISTDIYSGIGITYRDILDDLCQTIQGNMMFNVSGNLIIKTPTETSATVTDSDLKGDGVAIGELYGPINSLVLSRAGGSDTIFRKDDASILANGRTELNISDSYLLSTDDREDYIDEMFTQINGLQFYLYDISSVGILFLEPLDRYTISHNSVSYSTIALNDEIVIEKGLSERLYVEKPEESNIDYETSSITDKAIKDASILVNKNKSQIFLKVQDDGTVASCDLTTDAENGSSIKIKADNISLEGYTSINNSFTFDEEGNFIIGDYVNAGKYNLLEDSSGLLGMTNWTKSSEWTLIT